LIGAGNRQSTTSTSTLDHSAINKHSLRMNIVILPPPGAIREYCKNHGIHRLSLFGSATRDDFNSEQSDIDLIVEYKNGEHPGLNHFLIAEEFSELFGRKVDLNTPAMLGRHLQEITKEAKVLYEQA
jgi:uncharacterized protein